MPDILEDNPNIIFGIIIFVFLIIVFIISIKKTKDYTSYKKSLVVIGVGILNLLAGVIINSIEIGLWDLKTIISFFSLKTNLLFATVGYTLVLIGIFELLLAFINRSRNVNNSNHDQRVN